MVDYMKFWATVSSNVVANVTYVLFPQRNMSPVTRVGHQTQSYRRTPDYIFCSANLAIRAALLPASKLVSRLSQARERSSVPKLTSWLVNTGFCKVIWAQMAGQAYNLNGFPMY